MGKISEVNKIRNAFKKELNLSSTGRLKAGSVRDYTHSSISKNNTNKQIRDKLKKVGLSTKVAGIHSFSGTIETSKTYKDHTPGLFTQSVRGQKPKHLIKLSVNDALIRMASE